MITKCVLVLTYSRTYLLFLSDFNETWIFKSFISKNTLISNFMKIRPVGSELLHADGRTDMTKLFPILQTRQIKTVSKLPVLVITKFVETRWGYDVNFKVHTHARAAHTHTLTLTQNHAQSHTHSHTHSHTTHTLTHTHSHTPLTHTHSHTHSLSHTHTRSHSLTLTHAHSHWHSLTHTHAHTRSHSRTLTHTLTYTHTDTHTHTHYWIQQMCFDGLLFNFIWKPKWLLAVRESL